MGYKSGADGVAKSGKTVGKNLGDDGKKVGIESRKAKGSPSAVTSEAMKKYGSIMARTLNQGG